MQVDYLVIFLHRCCVKCKNVGVVLHLKLPEQNAIVACFLNDCKVVHIILMTIIQHSFRTPFTCFLS